MPEPQDIAESRAAVEAIIESGAITPVYQPIVRVDSGAVVAYEALARGPKGSDHERPDQLFAAARRAGLLASLDWACRTAAVKGALDARLRPPMALFVNIEPETAGARITPSFAEYWATARMVFLRLVFEITERAVTSRPAELLSNVTHMRRLQWGIALDDVGQEASSLAILPFVHPDVIKLDMRVVRDPAAPGIPELVLAVNAEAERSGALILAEGIENDEHLETAQAFGAHLGQGWLFGRPEPLPQEPFRQGDPILLRPPPEWAADDAATPFSIASAKLSPRKVRPAHLLGLARLLEKRAVAAPHPPVVLAGFQHVDHLAGETIAVYERFGRMSPLVAALGVDMPEEPLPGVRGVALSPADPLRHEWVLVVISPFWAAMLCAREIPRDVAGRRFDLILTFERDLVVGAANTLLRRVIGSREQEAEHAGSVDFAMAVAEIIARARDIEELAEPLLALMAESLDLESTYLSKVTDHRDYDVIVSHTRAGKEVPVGTHLPWSESVCKAALEAGKHSFRDVQAELPQVTAVEEWSFKTFVTVPVMRNGKVAGTLCGGSRREASLTEEELERVRTFARLIGARVDAAGRTSSFGDGQAAGDAAGPPGS